VNLRLFAHRWNSTCLCDSFDETRMNTFQAVYWKNLTRFCLVFAAKFRCRVCKSEPIFFVTVVFINVHRSLLLTHELIYRHWTVVTGAAGIETLDWSKNKQWNDTYLDSDAVQPITIHTQIETVDSNKPIRRRHDPRHEWHLKGKETKINMTLSNIVVIRWQFYYDTPNMQWRISVETAMNYNKESSFWYFGCSCVIHYEPHKCGTVISKDCAQYFPALKHNGRQKVQ
jgi:hypothetical protein